MVGLAVAGEIGVRGPKPGDLSDREGRDEVCAVEIFKDNLGLGTARAALYIMKIKVEISGGEK